MEKVPHHVEDRTVEDDHPLLDRLIADRLRQVRLAHPRRSEQQHVASLADEAAGRQIEDLLLLDRRIEGPIEIGKGLQFTKGRQLNAALNQPLAADG